MLDASACVTQLQGDRSAVPTCQGPVLRKQRNGDRYQPMTGENTALLLLLKSTNVAIYLKVTNNIAVVL